MSEVKPTLDNLRSAFNKMMNTDASNLTQEQKTELAININKTSKLISAIETQQIQGLTQAFASKLPELQRASDQLKRDLDGVNSASEVIGVVSQFLKTATNILPFIA
jgi:hypothetical protein